MFVLTLEWKKNKMRCTSRHPSVIHLSFPSACLCWHAWIFQELVRLRGDTHCQLRDGGRGGDVHQTRLSTLHLGTVSKSCVSASLWCFLSLRTLTNRYSTSVLWLPVRCSSKVWVISFGFPICGRSFPRASHFLSAFQQSRCLLDLKKTLQPKFQLDIVPVNPSTVTDCFQT